jgi:hypothetical protein
MRVLIENICIFSICFLFFSCQKIQEQKIFYQVESYRYTQGNPYYPTKTDLDLQIENQGDTLRRYRYFQQDTITKIAQVLMEVEVKNDSLFLMKVGDYKPNVWRMLEAKKVFYVGSKEIEVSKFKRVESEPDKHDAIFMTREFGIVNMLSYALKTKMIYKISADKTATNIVNKINTHLEKDTLGFYHQPNP